MKFLVNTYHDNLLKDKDRVSAFSEGINLYLKDKDIFKINSNYNNVKSNGSNYHNSHNILTNCSPDNTLTTFNPNNRLTDNSNKTDNDPDISSKIALDLGCGVGILSYFLVDYFDEIYSIELNKKTYDLAKKNLSPWKNVKVLNEDVKLFSINKKVDLIVCEMLDTALIDEEQVDAINNNLTHLKENGVVIPEGIINIVEPVEMKHPVLSYKDVNEVNSQSLDYKVLGEKMIFENISFNKTIEKDFHKVLNFKINKDGIFNAIKITTLTKVYKDLIIGPTPMLNPPLFIPLNKELKAFQLDDIDVELKFIKGDGLESINLSLLD